MKGHNYGGIPCRKCGKIHIDGMEGKHHSEETINKMREIYLKNPIKTMLGRHHSKETRLKMSIAHKGKIRTKEHCQHLSESLIGKHPSEEIRKKISEGHKGQKAWNKDIKGVFHHTKEAKGKIAIASLGRKHTEKTKAKLREKRLLQIIPKKDTKIEILLQYALKKEKISFQKHKPILGQPDIFIEPNICIFVDGDYWHNLLKVKKRDQKINKELTKNGYIVLRFWEHEINYDLLSIIQTIKTKMKVF